MPQADIKLLCPKYGVTTLLVEYTANGVHDKQRYTITKADRSEWGKPVQSVDVNDLLSMNWPDDVDQAIINATQSGLRKGLEAFDWKQDKPAKKIVRKPKQDTETPNLEITE